MGRWWLVVLALTLATPSVAAEGDEARTFPTRTLNSVNYAPSTSGEDISAYDGTCSIQLVVTSGQIRVNVETAIHQQDGTALGWTNTGTLDESETVNLSGSVNRVRYNVTCCETDCTDGSGGAGSCLAAAVMRCRK